MKKQRVVGFKEFEERCKELAIIIKGNKQIKNIYGITRGGAIPAIRISYLTGLPITSAPKKSCTAIIEDVQDSGSTRHSFSNFNYFFPLVDKQYETIKEWVVFWYEK